MWIKRLLEELKFPIDSPMRIFCDNQAAISVAKNLVHHDRTKHVEIDCHFTKEQIVKGIITLEYMPIALQTADIFTKALPRVNFEEMKSKLGMLNIYSPARGGMLISIWISLICWDFYFVFKQGFVSHFLF